MEIKIEIGNWQYNAGIVGLYNILYDNREESVRIEENEIIFDSSELENFEEKYFNYLIKIYIKTLSWYKIVSYENKVKYFKEKVENKELTLEDIEDINKYIKDILKKYLKSNSYISSYDFIESKINPLILEKALKVITIKKNENILDKLEEVKEILENLEEIINYFQLKNSKKYIGGKNIIYTIIKNAWDGVSFLYPQTKEKDIYKDYKNYFLNPIDEYFKEEEKKLKYNCFICDRKIKNFDNDFNFLVNTGFDTNRKLSHIWNFTNDIAMCPICKLVYSCIPAGFTYLYSNGIFINANTNINELIRINNRIKYELYNEDTLYDIYRVLEKELQEDIKYELEDIQLVRFEDGKYYFNILSKKNIRTIIESKKEFEVIGNQSYNLNNENHKVNIEIIQKLLNNENLFLLIHKMIVSKLTIKEKNYIKENTIFSVIKINYRILEEGGYMEDKNIDTLTRARTAGKNLKRKYEDKGAEHKLSGICYKILNGLKTNNISMTMDTILNCYLYCNEGVPKIITEMMSNEEIFKEIGYSFVSGILSINFEEKDEDNNK